MNKFAALFVVASLTGLGRSQGFQNTLVLNTGVTMSHSALLYFDGTTGQPTFDLVGSFGSGTSLFTSTSAALPNSNYTLIGTTTDSLGEHLVAGINPALVSPSATFDSIFSGFVQAGYSEGDLLSALDGGLASQKDQLIVNAFLTLDGTSQSFVNAAGYEAMNSFSGRATVGSLNASAATEPSMFAAFGFMIGLLGLARHKFYSLA